MWHDVGDLLTTNSEGHPLTGLDGRDDLRRLITQLPDTDLHVLHDSTSQTSAASQRVSATGEEDVTWGHVTCDKPVTTTS